ncbi:hypothetical protein, conserved [Leishmania tarentolae]|uniref:mRNA 5'-phosphatase n=1 Tax=Leishmania tarentolae TaxID=5689 RepID=A0A640KD52_LEITA|nr:hypothetical protein, conserved [Leishmania tarentolae]
MRSLQRVPRYRDPLVRNVARMLLRALQEQHHAPSSTQLELEVRLGSILAHTRARQLDIPIAIASPALMDETARNVYQFQAGVSNPILHGMQAALLEAGLATRKDMNVRGGKVDVHLFLSNAKRLCCSYQPLHTETLGMHTDGVKTPASHREAPLYNPLCLIQSIKVLSAQKKSRLATLDMCCPGWCADVRFALSQETTVPVELTDATREKAIASRCRARTSIPVGRFLSVQLTQSIFSQDVWWYPPPDLCTNLENGAGASPSPEAFTGTTVFGVGTVIPTPVLFYREKAAEHIGRSGAETTIEVEVEINLRALLREWKRVYGCAAASAYLSASALVDTTCAGTALPGGASLKQPGDASARDDDANVHATVLAEREDPYLLRVAEEVMAVVQLLTKVRVVE